jgi:hypothetical protein
VQLPKDARFRTNFSVDPDEFTTVGGVLIERTMIDTSSAASSYSSRMIEYR